MRLAALRASEMELEESIEYVRTQVVSCTCPEHRPELYKVAVRCRGRHCVVQYRDLGGHYDVHRLMVCSHEAIYLANEIERYIARSESDRYLFQRNALYRWQQMKEKVVDRLKYEDISLHISVELIRMTIRMFVGLLFFGRLKTVTFEWMRMDETYAFGEAKASLIRLHSRSLPASVSTYSPTSGSSPTRLVCSPVSSGLTAKRLVS
jgi:hypothetical protein